MGGLTNSTPSFVDNFYEFIDLEIGDLSMENNSDLIARIEQALENSLEAMRKGDQPQQIVLHAEDSAELKIIISKFIDWLPQAETVKPYCTRRYIDDLYRSFCNTTDNKELFITTACDSVRSMMAGSPETALHITRDLVDLAIYDTDLQPHVKALCMNALDASPQTNTEHSRYYLQFIAHFTPVEKADMLVDKATTLLLNANNQNDRKHARDAINDLIERYGHDEIAMSYIIEKGLSIIPQLALVDESGADATSMMMYLGGAANSSYPTAMAKNTLYENGLHIFDQIIPDGKSPPNPFVAVMLLGMMGEAAKGDVAKEAHLLKLNTDILPLIASIQQHDGILILNNISKISNVPMEAFDRLEGQNNFGAVKFILNRDKPNNSNFITLVTKEGMRQTSRLLTGWAAFGFQTPREPLLNATQAKIEAYRAQPTV